MASLHTVLRKFDAEASWESYSRELEQYFEVNGVLNDNERVAILLTILSPSVYKVLRDSCRPELPRLKTYAELSELLNIHHSPRPSVFKQRIEFFRARQTPTESVNDWLGRIMRLAASCDFDNQLDTVLKDNFVSGFANRTLVHRLCEENISSATLGGLVDLAEKYAPLCSNEASILDLPDEVLKQIVSLLSPRERVPLGNSCHRFKSLVFEDQELLRYLDFSKKARMTTMAQIQQYFNNKNACQHILRVDARNVYCIKAGDALNNSIGRAMNLVEVNIHGTQFEDIWQFGSFLNPLQHLEKLSIDWPINVGNDISICKRILQRPFSKLTYLSVELNMSAFTTFTSSLLLCQQLKELNIKEIEYDTCEETGNYWNGGIRQLTNLKIVHYCGQESTRIYNDLAKVLPDPKRWTHFQLSGDTSRHQSAFYIEKDVEVCEELLQSERLDDFLNTAPWEDFNLKWSLDPEYLLEEVLIITHEHGLDDLCCLTTKGGKPVLKIEEAKLLLKDARYQISYLCLDHDLERRCDAHLLASAFPNLSELVLSAVTRNLEKAPKDSYFQRRLSRRCSTVDEKQDALLNLDSSFKMLVENTPHLKHFTLNPKGESIEDWDWSALCLISGWQNLETLHIEYLRYKDGQFLIEIGKQCKNLQKLFLWQTTPQSTKCNKGALLEMLKYCRNLRDFTIRCSYTDQAEMFASLAKNVELETVKAINYHREHLAAPWISSLENLVRQCAKLTTIICESTFKTKEDHDEVMSAVKRIKRKSRRPDFQIEVTSWTYELRFAKITT